MQKQLLGHQGDLGCSSATLLDKTFDRQWHQFGRQGIVFKK